MQCSRSRTLWSAFAVLCSWTRTRSVVVCASFYFKFKCTRMVNELKQRRLRRPTSRLRSSSPLMLCEWMEIVWKVEMDKRHRQCHFQYKKEMKIKGISSISNLSPFQCTVRCSLAMETKKYSGRPSATKRHFIEKTTNDFEFFQEND